MPDSREWWPREVFPPILLGLFAAGVSSNIHRWVGGEPLGWAGLLLLGLAFVVLIGRHRSPYLALVGSVAATGLYLGTGHPPGPVFLAPAWGTVAVISHARDWRHWSLALILGGLALAGVHGWQSHDLEGASIFLGVWLVAGTAIGLGLSVRRRFLAEVSARRELGQRSQLQEEGRRLAEERLRIAREVHDVVGHSLAVISLQAGVAEHLVDSKPEEVRRAVAAIRRVSRQALGELRVELSSLRDGSPPAGTAPTPGLRALPELVQVMRDAGLEIGYHSQGDDEAPAVVASTAYRIVQEALTNVARHVGSHAQVEVRVRTEPGSLTVEVTDRGRGAEPAGPPVEGHGITGMRERVAALGGRFEIAPGGGGLRVFAQLPWIRP